MADSHGYTIDFLAKAFQVLKDADLSTPERLMLAWWAPLAKRLHRLAATNPTEVLCVSNAEYSRRHVIPMREVMVGIVVPDNEVIYLCDVLNMSESAYARSESDTAVERTDAQLLVFTDVPEVTPDILPEAVRRCLQECCPALALLPIRWLPDDIALAIFDDARAN